MISLDFLEQVDVFKNLDDSQLSAIQERAEAVEFKKGDRIFVQGDNATDVWIAREGDVELRTEDPAAQKDARAASPSFLSKTQVFGWTCFVPPHTYRLSGYCGSRTCKVIRLKRESLLAIFEKDAMLGFKVMDYLVQTVGKQFEELQDEIARNRGIEMMSQW
jgi:CRP-like cAMP-binding protein